MAGRRYVAGRYRSTTDCRNGLLIRFVESRVTYAKTGWNQQWQSLKGSALQA